MSDREVDNKAFRELFVGLIAGAANIFSGYPFDTVKVRLQADRGVYNGAWHCLKHIIRYEGISHGLYRGLTPPLIGGAMETGINYLVYNQTLRLLKENINNKDEKPLWNVPIAAGTAGFFLSFVLGPTELIKCRMQVARGTRFQGPLQCLSLSLEHEGFRGLTRGMGATMAREMPGNAIFFTTYELLRRQFPGKTTAPSEFRTIPEIIADSASAVICGGLAGSIMWTFVLPIDVGKTRLQAAFPGDKYDVGMLKQLKMLWKEGKWLALYAGFTPTMIRAFPANAAQWLVWELAYDRLDFILKQF